MNFIIPKVIIFITIKNDNNKFAVYLQYKNGGIIMQSQMSSIIKGASVGLIAGVAMGIAGKKMIDDNPKIRKQANKAMRAVGSIIDTAQYMLK